MTSTLFLLRLTGSIPAFAFLFLPMNLIFIGENFVFYSFFVLISSVADPEYLCLLLVFYMLQK